MPDRYAAFISYSHRYKEWVAALQQNLQLCLEAAGAQPSEVFLDQTDLASGRSWVAQLQEGVSKSRHLILVATPEALASPRAADEWEGFVTLHRDWAAGRLHIVHLVDAPLPPFLDRIQRLDFVDHDEKAYLRELRKLTGGLLGREARNLPKLPEELEVPGAPQGTLPTKLRQQLVAWLEPQVSRTVLRPAVAHALGIPLTALEGHGSPRCAASAALVVATGDDDAVTGAQRIVRGLQATFKDEEEEELLGKLAAIAMDLERLSKAGDGTLLGRWLARVARDHSNLVPFFEHADLELLDRVYVQLDLRPETRILRGKEEEAALRVGGKPLTIRDLLALDPQDHAWVTGRWMVLGDPGSGKTTLLRHLAAQLAEEKERRWVPVFESLPRLMRKPEWLLDRLEREMRKAGEPVQGLASALDREGQEGQLLLLLDGLDEVPREDKEDAEALLRQLSARWPRTPLVVTSRPIGYQRPGSEFVELELLPFHEGQRREFLENWFGRPTCKNRPGLDHVMKVLRGESGLWELSGNPLYLTLMALLFEQKKEPARNRADLYDDVFDLLLDGRHRPAGKPIDAKKGVRGVLRQLAYDMTGDNVDVEPRQDLEARLLHESYDALCKPLRRVPAWNRSLGTFLDDFAQKVGILGPHDGPTADWRYWHRTFREALTAEHLAAEFKAGGKQALVERAQAVAGDESRWAEPFALMVGRVKDPDAVVTSLVEANRALGLRALATAQQLGDETLRSVLALTEDWEERSQVFEEIPDLMDDPERALALVDQLRQRTRNGNDLFFLDEALNTIGERWPDVARRVEDLRKSFFSHIPAPPEDLFLWVETPKDGRVELWRTIPAGEGWVGAADSEEGYEDERPRHQVRILHPFAMAAVQVTNAQYAAFDETKPFGRFEGVSDDELPHHPRVEVTWFEAVAFCRWLAHHVPGARLPVEEEWEYACRAGTETAYWSGSSEKDLSRVGWYDGNSEGRTHRVGEKEASPWGLYDLHGNVLEWTATEWDLRRYQGRSSSKPHAIDLRQPPLAAPDPRGEGRVIRGGSAWSTADWARAAFRDWRHPGDGIGLLGFRVVLPVPEPAVERGS